MSNFFFVPVVNHTVDWWNFMTFLAFFSIFLFVAVVEILANYSLFRKFGDIEPWKGLIPIYSTFLLYRRYYGSGLFILFLLIPYVNIWFSFGLMWRMAKSFGKDIYWFIFLMVLLNPIGELILAFGTTKYNKYSLDLNKKEVA